MQLPLRGVNDRALPRFISLPHALVPCAPEESASEESAPEEKALGEKARGPAHDDGPAIAAKFIVPAGLALSCIAHVVFLGPALILAGGSPFNTPPAEAITVDIVSSEELSQPVDDQAQAETANANASVSSSPTAPNPPAPPVAAASSAMPPTLPRPDPSATRQARATPQPPATPQTPPSMLPPPPFVPPQPPQIQPPQAAEPNDPASMFAMPLTLPGGKVGGDFDANAIEKANVAGTYVTAFRSHLKTCLTLPKSVSRTSDVRLKMRVWFQPDGTLGGEPVLAGGSPMGPLLKDSVIKGLRACQPYAMLPADKYNEWREVDLTFAPQDFGR
jgi:hypothetical protein